MEKVEKVVDQFVVPSDAGPDSIEGSKKTDQVVITGANSLLHRECKIAGQIGPPDARDKLTYVSLMRQIQECEEKGYQESEIVSAIIRAMVPGLQLHSYLESTPPNPLKRLKKILRSHFREKSATELYQELTNMTQRPDEDALAFLLRAFELRSKVCLASGEEGSLQYDVTLVNGLTAHTIETGLSPENENIRSQIRPFLKTPGISDVDLITQMRIIMAAEDNRKSKIAAATTTPETVQVKSKQQVKGKHINVNAVTAPDKKTSLASDGQTNILEAIKQLQAQVASLTTVKDDLDSVKSDLTKLKKQQPQQQVRQLQQQKLSDPEVQVRTPCLSKVSG